MNEVKIRPEDMVTRVLGSLSNIINPPVKESDRQGTTTIRTLSLLHCYHIRPLVSSSVVGLVLYVHHPPLSSERSDRRPSAVGSGVRRVKVMNREPDMKVHPSSPCCPRLTIGLTLLSFPTLSRYAEPP